MLMWHRWFALGSTTAVVLVLGVLGDSPWLATAGGCAVTFLVLHLVLPKAVDPTNPPHKPDHH